MEELALIALGDMLYKWYGLLTGSRGDHHERNEGTGRAGWKRNAGRSIGVMEYW